MEQIRLYDYAASANCYKVRLLLAQLGRDYERIPVDIFAGETLGDDYARINPERTVPVLGLAGGGTLPDSAAILVYLAHGTSLLPSEPLELARAVRWLVFEQTEVVPPIGGLRFRLMTGRSRPDDPDALRRHRAGEQVLDLLDSHLEDRGFFLDSGPSVVDIAMYGYLHVAGDAGYELSSRPALSAWLDRVASRPGHMDDLVPYPPNARPGAGRSIYD